MIRLKNVSKFYNSNDKIIRALEDVSVYFDKSEIVALKGKSGSGKSTLLKLISRDIYCDFGECITIDNITSAYQDFKLINAYTVYENIFFVANLYYDKEMSEQLTSNIIKGLNLSNVKDVVSYKLSTGEKQRVAIARALISKNRVLVFDEPTSNLDNENAINVIHMLKEYSINKLVIIASHDDRIDNICDRIITLDNGTIIKDERVNNSSENLEIVNNEINYNYQYVVKHNFLRHSLVSLFSFISMLIISFSFILCVFSIDSVSDTKFKNPVNGLCDDKTLIYDKDGINKDELLGIDYYEMNPFYLTYSEEFTTINTSNTIIASYESIKLKNLDYGRIPTNDNEVCVYIPKRLKKIVSKEDYIGGIINIPNSSYEITIVGIKFVDDISSECFAYNDILKTYLQYKNFDFYYNKKEVSIVYKNENKLVLPLDSTNEQLYSTYSNGSSVYNFTYDINVVYDDVEEPVLYLSLNEELLPNEVYEVLVLGSLDGFTNNNHSILKVSDYNNYKVSKNEAFNIISKILIIIISTVVALYIEAYFFNKIKSFENDGFEQIYFLVKNKKYIRNTIIIERSIIALLTLLPMIIFGILLIGIFKTFIITILFISFNIILLKKVGERYA